MSNYTEIIESELKLLDGVEKSIVFLNTTSKKGNEFSVLPRREAFGHKAVGFFIGSNSVCDHVTRLIDGKVKYVLVDVEVKQDLDLLSIAESNIKTSAIIPFKPNDITVESCDLLLRNISNEQIKGKNVLIFGAGNLASKIALKLAERQAAVSIEARNRNKAEAILTGLNYILPPFNQTKIELFNKEDKTRRFDIVISFLSADRIVEHDVLDYVKDNAIIIDGGINNFTEGFIERALRMNHLFFRLDTRIAFSFALLCIIKESQDFFDHTIGTVMVEGIRCVAGGVVGNNGDVILDRIKEPSQVIGISNGVGGVKHESAYTIEDRRKIDTVQKTIL